MNTGNSFTGILQQAAAVLLLAAFFFFGGIRMAEPAGLLVAEDGFGGVLEIKEHAVKVTINNGIAVTHVTQVFHNTENRQVEALYTFPVPRGASVANFSMWINEKEMVGEVLEKQRAREIYNSYKQKRRDPGLLEQKDYKTFEMRIFPIGAGADQKVEISYYQELEIDHDRGVYVYPLATVSRKDITAKTTGKFAIDVEIKSPIPVTAVESPSHGDQFVISDVSENYKLASLETTGGLLSRDVVVAYDLARPKTGVDLLTSVEPGDDGYFYLTLTTGKELEKLDTGMDYVFLMDISGSMGNDSKLILSRKSVEAFVEELGADDRFEVITFNRTPDTLFSELRPASDKTRQQAEEYMRSRRTGGGTELAPAMNTAYKYGNPDRTLNVVILSDGMSEQADRRTLINLIESRPRNARVFCIGVGNEVNRPLLEQMADESGGLAAFISHGDNFKRQAQGFRRKLTRPVATDLVMEFSGVQVFNIEPEKLPALYYGSPLRIYGRYSGSGPATVTLRGNVQGTELKQSVELEFPERDSENPEIERMWAWKRTDRLLKMADREGRRGSELTDEIIRLGEEYSIVTEYTSFLVLENDAEYQRWQIERRNSRRIDRDRGAQSRRKDMLAALRKKAVDGLGPQPESKAEPEKIKVVPTAPASNPPAVNAPIPDPASAPRPRRSQSSDFGGFGSGPVGPFFVGLSWWLRRKKAGKGNGRP